MDEGAGALEQLLLGDAEVTGGRLGLDVEADPLERAGGVATDTPPIDERPYPPARQDTRVQVLGGRQVGHQGGLLRDQVDAVLERAARGEVRKARAAELDPAGVGGIEAAQHLEERRLPRAVLAEQRVDLTRGEADGHVVEDGRTAERLAKAVSGKAPAGSRRRRRGR
ncbi:MAG: hypothetical protein M0T71_06715 [Actinomycetota bacterium]|nr:hypothetical protein [Actinomycetota bacterium]